MKWRKVFLLAVLFAPAMFATVGCEVDADTDDDGAKIEIEKD
jgi:hypothetical protein